MHIVYILSEDISKVSGVVKKIETQTKYWTSAGHKVDIVSLKSDTLTSIIKNGVILSEYIKEKNLKKKIQRRLTISKKLDRYLFSKKPDVIYLRYMIGMPDIVKVLKKYAPFFVEINSNDVEESKIYKKSLYLLNILTRNYLLKNASALISVSNELMNNKIFSKFHKKFIVIGNGYDFGTIRKKKLFFNNKPKLIFIGSPYQIWHGVDKILILASKLKDYEFNIVGISHLELQSYGEVPDNIILHGYCDSVYLDKLIPQCDIGISTLALHRKNMCEASPLKSREYLAYGLPIILGYKDTDLQENLKFVLNIGNYENNVFDNIKNIEIFIRSCIHMSPAEIIDNSKKYLDYEEKEKLRLNFLEQMLLTISIKNNFQQHKKKELL